MSTDSPWIPAGIPLDKPSAARMYDYLLGGYHNFEVDRQAVQAVIEAFPEVRLVAHANRAFLRRVVTFFAEQGIDQFLDLGSGIPTVGNVHEVAQTLNPAARVVYVDIDPVATAHSQAILKDNPKATAIQADVRQPERILSHAEVQSMLDFSKPVATLLLAILHFVTDDEEAYGVVRILRDALVPDSFIAISHASHHNAPPDVIERIEQATRRASASTKYRSRAQIQRFFDGLELVDPGLVSIPLWRPEERDDVLLDQPERALALAGAGRKP